MTVPTPYEAFNARALSPRDVAKSFVPPRQFQQLSRPSHSLLIGPRGSGKTTLLKMLTPEALTHWAHADAEGTRARITYSGIFIPTDISWGRQLDMLGRAGLAPEHATPLVSAAFTTSVLRAFVAGVAQRTRGSTVEAEGAATYRALELSSADEASLATDVASIWDLPVRLPSFAGLLAALSLRLQRLHMIAGRERLLDAGGRSERLANQHELHLDLVTACSGLLDAVEARVPGARDERWALLFDELELAPAAVREELLAAMRSVDARFLFKLSISPYSEDLVLLEGALSAMPGHDYEEVLLTYGNKEDSVAFSMDLFGAILSSKGWTGSPTEVLGRSDFDTEPDEWRSHGHAYAPGGRLGKRFRQLAHGDATFRDYLSKNSIDLDLLENVSSLQRAQVLRKVNALVSVRATFRADDSVTIKTRRRLRSRKAPDLYRGASSLFAMLEGNPRWLIGTANKLLEGLSPGEAVSASRQSREVSRTLARFRSLLTTIPTADYIGPSRRGLLPVLDAVGEYFTHRVVLDDFNPDPPGSFTVDSDAPPELQEALGRALNAGAIIYVPDPDSANVMSSLRGKRFRLSYIFSPHYYLPIRLGRAVSLGLILRGGPEVQSQTQLEPQTQLELKEGQ